MAPPRDVEYDSDSEDEDVLSEIETNVLLGVPDGHIENQSEIDDAAVSRIGGFPICNTTFFVPKAFLTSEPSMSSVQCKTCLSPIELLVQLWSPFEDSTMDRALYVFGCSRSACQKKEGSVRAFRALRHNAEYAAKLERKRERAREKEAEKTKAAEMEAQAKERAKVNPFSMHATSNSSSGGLFGGPPPSFGVSGGLGAQLFGSPSAKEDESPEPEVNVEDNAEEPPPSDDESSDSDSESTSSHSLVEALTSRPSESSPWLTQQPAFKPALYLSTASEYIPPPPKQKLPSGAKILEEHETDVGVDQQKSRKASAKQDKADAGAKSSEDAEWNNAMEGYENSLNMDHVFERFLKRVSYEGEQCLRYELGGTPLPFASDNVFKSLFPDTSAHENTAYVSRSNVTVSSAPARRMYDPASSSIAPCERCGAKRVFECQLMPNLINVLRESEQGGSAESDGDSKQQRRSEEERKKEIANLLKGAGRGMEWGTCMVFSCSEDCCLESENAPDGRGRKGADAKECWKEELVLVQWEE